jgi:uncharacterized protein GlcG (DUF336 family)
VGIVFYNNDRYSLEVFVAGQRTHHPGRRRPCPLPGGVLIRNTTGEIVGAVGVSGHLPDDDEDCAIHGITACGLRPDPGD